MTASFILSFKALGQLWTEQRDLVCSESEKVSKDPTMSPSTTHSERHRPHRLHLALTDSYPVSSTIGQCVVSSSLSDCICKLLSVSK